MTQRSILGESSANLEAVCGCGHPAVDHHGSDRGSSGGCFGDKRGLLDPARCECRRTCSDVSAVCRADSRGLVLGDAS